MQKIRRAFQLSSFLYLDRKAFVETYPACTTLELAPRACLADRAFRLNNRVNTAVSYLSDNSVSCGRTASDIEIFVNNSYKEAVACSLWLRLYLGCVITPSFSHITLHSASARVFKFPSTIRKFASWCEE